MKRVLLCALALFALNCHAGNYTNFDVSIYIPVNVVRSFQDPQKLQDDWARISRQLKVDKVYIEVQRDRNLATDDLLERVKAFFLEHHVRVAGGMALSDGGSGQFKSFCYTDANDRAFVKNAAELAARHFDEIIQDDFFFVTTKTDSDIAAKGTNSWTQFRLNLMDEALENLIIKPARAVNPRVKVIVKFPNWYEHFPGSGYDLDKEPKMADGIYTGTETRDPVLTDQHLQQYESYHIFRYFENIAPGRNGGGWVDTYSINYIDRYAEQLWDTLFAKAPEMMLFEWTAMGRPIQPGNRAGWEHLQTSFNYAEMLQSKTNPTMASVAAYSVEQVDAFLGKLGNPIGVASYKPYQSSGEDFLHNYFGMIGIPIDLHPEFPTNASLVLLTESAKCDPDIVAKIKNQLAAGKSVVITSGLLRALQGKGIEDIAEVQYTDRKVLARRFSSGFGAGNASGLNEASENILFPQIVFLTNDAWSLLRAEANGNAFPLFLMDKYSRGVLYVWTIPENFNDLYSLPYGATSIIKNFIMRGFPARVDGPAQVALFAYDNQTFIVQNYLSTAADVNISTSGNSEHLKNLVTGENLEEQEPAQSSRQNRGQNEMERRVSFKVHLPPHSYKVFAIEK
jgi:hypothetical protein